LVAAAQAGDVRAFGDLIERHRGMCLKRAMLMMRNRSDAEDEVQNAFWKAFQRLDQFRGEGTFAAWLSRRESMPDANSRGKELAIRLPR
jgi:RNA polymerase sigma-70 factor (ECF subfamily)